MRVTTSRFARRLSVILVAAVLLTVTVPAYSADKTAHLAVAISTITDKMGSININVGKGEGVKEGARGVIVRDGKEIGKYIVQQVNWGFSRIVVSDLAEGVTVRPGDSAPLTGATDGSSSVKKKSKTKLLLTVLAVGAAILLLGGRGGGSSDSSVGDIVVTTQKSSTTTSNGVTTCTVTLTARVYDENGLLAPDDTPVTFSTTAGTLNRTETVVTAGIATATLSYNSSYDPDSAIVTVKALGKTVTVPISFVQSIELVANPDDIQTTGSGGPVTQSTVTATCLDAQGNPPATGTVKFTATLGNFTLDTVPIGSDGRATTTFRSPTAGRADITATWLNSKATATVTITAGPPANLTVTSDRTSIGCDGNSYATITATVKDVANHAVEDGTVVNFAVIPDGGGGGNGSIVPVQGATINGVATAHLFSRDGSGNTSLPGTARVRVQVLAANQPSSVLPPTTDLIHQTTQVQFVSVEIGEIILSANPVSVRGLDRSGNTSTITARVLNTSGQPVPDGTGVYFTATNGTITNYAATTGGIASATLTTVGAGGDVYVDITATSGDFSYTATDLVTFTGAPVQVNSTANISSTSIPRGGGATVTVVLRDSNNNLVARGLNVTARVNNAYFISPGTRVTSAVTENDGTVQFTVLTTNDSTQPTPLGSDAVTITAESVTFTLNFTVVAP